LEQLHIVQLPLYFQAFIGLLKIPPSPGTLNVLFFEETYEKIRTALGKIFSPVILDKKAVENGTLRIKCYHT